VEPRVVSKIVQVIMRIMVLGSVLQVVKLESFSQLCSPAPIILLAK